MDYKILIIHKHVGHVYVKSEGPFQNSNHKIRGTNFFFCMCQKKTSLTRYKKKLVSYNLFHVICFMLLYSNYKLIKR